MPQKPPFPLRNREGRSEYDLPADFNVKHRDGISAILRLKDEAEWIVPCLLAVRNFFDEFIIAYNGTQDATRELVAALELPNVATYEYPFEIAYRGRTHTTVPPDSLHHSAYFLNFCVSKVTRRWAAKWDGDMVALPVLWELREPLRSNEYTGVRFPGFDLVSESLDALGSQELCGPETRFFRLGPRVGFVPSFNKFTHDLKLPGEVYLRSDPVFLHFKWAKKNPMCYWPADWREDAHFQGIYQRHVPVKKYEGIYPQVLADYVECGRDPWRLIELYRRQPQRDPLQPVAGLHAAVREAH